MINTKTFAWVYQLLRGNCTFLQNKTFTPITLYSQNKFLASHNETYDFAKQDHHDIQTTHSKLGRQASGA